MGESRRERSQEISDEAIRGTKMPFSKPRTLRRQAYFKAMPALEVFFCDDQHHEQNYPSLLFPHNCRPEPVLFLQKSDRHQCPVPWTLLTHSLLGCYAPICIVIDSLKPEFQPEPTLSLLHPPTFAYELLPLSCSSVCLWTFDAQASLPLNSDPCLCCQLTCLCWQFTWTSQQLEHGASNLVSIELHLLVSVPVLVQISIVKTTWSK